jgi:proteasome lid subunit RPN8/RPN11
LADLGVPGLSARLRESIYDHVFANQDREVGGVLVGYLDEGELPHITTAIAALEADGQRASVTFTHEAWAKIHARMDAYHPNQQIVGWYHSHPGFGIFLSSYDEFIHQNFFSDRRQIAYVIDPLAGTEGVFHWASGNLERLSEGPTDIAGIGRPSPKRHAPPRVTEPTPRLQVNGGSSGSHNRRRLAGLDTGVLATGVALLVVVVLLVLLVLLVLS